MDQAVFFPLPANAENAWKAGSALHFSPPRALAMSCAGIYRNFLPLPNAIWTFRMWTTDIASTTTSVSTVRIVTLVYPFLTASIACRIKRVSASSWLQFSRRLTSWSLVQRTPPPYVVINSFLSPSLSEPFTVRGNQWAQICFCHHAENSSISEGFDCKVLHEFDCFFLVFFREEALRLFSVLVPYQIESISTF